MELTAIYRYPVKSLRGQELSVAQVEPIGLAGDRRWLVVDEALRFRTIRQSPKMAQIMADITVDGLTLRHPDVGTCSVALPSPSAPTRQITIWRDSVAARIAEEGAGAFLSRVLGEPVKLAYLAHPTARPVDARYGMPQDHVSFADGYPILLTSLSSLDELGAHLGGEISMRRFRPNLVIGGAAAWEEDTWRAIRIGKTSFRVVKPCGRCVVTTRDPDTGAQLDAQEPLRTLGKIHRARDGEIIFGQNLIPDEAGVIQVGDKVEILSAGASNLL